MSNQTNTPVSGSTPVQQPSSGVTIYSSLANAMQTTFISNAELGTVANVPKKKSGRPRPATNSQDFREVPAGAKTPALSRPFVSLPGPSTQANSVLVSTAESPVDPVPPIAHQSKKGVILTSDDEPLLKEMKAGLTIKKAKETEKSAASSKAKSKYGKRKVIQSESETSDYQPPKGMEAGPKKKKEKSSASSNVGFRPSRIMRKKAMAALATEIQTSGIAAMGQAVEMSTPVSDAAVQTRQNKLIRKARTAKSRGNNLALPSSSVAHHQGPLNQTASANTTLLQKVAENNRYGLLLRYEPDGRLFNTLAKNLKNDIKILTTCSTCKKLFEKSSLVSMLFSPCRLKEFNGTATEIDSTGLFYTVIARHVGCLSDTAFRQLLHKSQANPSQMEFRSGFYVHPNVCADGWVEFQQLLAQKITSAPGSQEVEVPQLPKFWDRGEVGSASYMWPPQIFLEWVGDVKSGKQLQFSATPHDSK